MTNRLDAYIEGRAIGCFERRAGEITWQYAPDVTKALSLSLPLDGTWSRNAPRRFLGNLLPDNMQVRDQWARKLGTTPDPFDLLTHVGQDVAGALVLLPPGQDPHAARPITRISFDELAEQVASVVHNQAFWLSADLLGKTRMSLAGFAGKFTARKIGEDWYWPTATSPSTHIFKPEPTNLLHLAHLEAVATLVAWQDEIIERQCDAIEGQSAKIDTPVPWVRTYATNEEWWAVDALAREHRLPAALHRSATAWATRIMLEEHDIAAMIIR